MQIKKLSNTEIFGLDWAAADRRELLRSMHRQKLRRATQVSSGWGTNVAGVDKRSVQASLNGKGDLRAAWWDVYSGVYMRLLPSADLERAMYSFHRMHHTLTWGWRSYLVSLCQTAVDFRQRGLMAAMRAAVDNGSHI